MKTSAAISLFIACLMLIFCSGCVNQPTVQPPVTQAVTVPGTPAASITVPLTSVPDSTTPLRPAKPEPAATDSLPQKVTTLPPATAVDIGIVKDRVYNTITVTFIGGPGQVLVNNVHVRVTTSDGAVEEKNIPSEGQVPTGASIDMTGTKGSDRVEVFVTMGGITYKLKDENMTYTYY
jgi:hypothetical protein